MVTLNHMSISAVAIGTFQPCRLALRHSQCASKATFLAPYSSQSLNVRPNVSDGRRLHRADEKSPCTQAWYTHTRGGACLFRYTSPRCDVRQSMLYTLFDVRETKALAVLWSVVPDRLVSTRALRLHLPNGHARLLVMQ
jgi:hypothetical protein